MPAGGACSTSSTPDLCCTLLWSHHTAVAGAAHFPLHTLAKTTPESPSTTGLSEVPAAAADLMDVVEEKGAGAEPREEPRAAARAE